MELTVGYASLILVTVKNIVIRKDLKGHARSLRALLPAFCRRPIDAYQNIGPLCKLLITFIKKDSHMHKIVAIAVKVSVRCFTTHFFISYIVVHYQIIRIQQICM